MTDTSDANFTLGSGGGGITTLTVNAAAVTGTISPALDADWYQFTVATAGAYTIDTNAGTLTDSILDLYGPNSQTTFITENDDYSGTDLMAQITQTLSPGTYYVKATGYSTYTGTYTIRVTTPAAAATLTVTSPNGGETWPISSAQTITWTSTGLLATSYVKIELSRNGGTTWTTLTASTPNDGTHPWTVSGTATTQARIRITSTSQPTVTDTSDANFTLGSGGGGVSYSAEEIAFLGLINQYRQANGLGTLLVSDAISDACDKHNRDMGKYNFFDHYSLSSDYFPVGSSPWDRMRICGYDYSTSMAENIAAGQSTAQAVFLAWKNSPGHNTNMLGADYKVIGISLEVVAGSTYTYYWTTDFGGVVDPGAHVLVSPAGDAGITLPDPAPVPGVGIVGPEPAAQLAGTEE